MKLAERLPFTEQEAGGVTAGSDLAKLQEWLRDAENSVPETQFRIEAIEDYNMYAGDQDTTEVKAILESQNRPTTTFNEVKPKVDMLIGLAAQTKHEVTVVPVGVEDQPLAELMGGVYKYFFKKVKMMRRLLECFEHGVKSGRSLLHFYVDRSNPFSPEIKLRRIPGHSFWIDPDSVEYDLSDARYVFLDKWLTREEIMSYWPDFDPEAGASTTYPAAESELSFFNEAKDKYRIVECWYRKQAKVVWFMNPLTVQPESLPPKEFAKFNSVLVEGRPEVGIPPGQPVEGIGSIINEVHYSIFSGMTELEKGKSPYRWKDFPFAFFGAYKNTDENRWFGVVSMMKDPQRSLNTMRRQLSHLLQTLPKGMLVHEAGAVLNIEEYEQRSSDPTFHLEMAQGKIDKAQFVQQPQISPIYQQLDAVFSQSMKDASGIQDTLMGVQTSSREPGITVAKRQETGLAVLYMLYDNFAETRMLAGKILLSFIQQYVTMPTVVRIQGPSGMELAQINSQMNPQNQGFNDISAGEFDLEVDDTVETKTSRLATAQLLSEFSHNNPGAVPPDIVLDYSDVPWTIQQRVKAAWEAQRQQEQANIEADRELEIMKINASLRKAQEDNDTKKEVAKSRPKPAAKGSK